MRMQLPLFPDMDLDDVKSAVLKRKSYIQPFESILAEAELCGLLGKNSNGRFSQAADETVFLELNAEQIQILENRLAYWEKIGVRDQVYLTKQITYELSDDDSLTFDDLVSGRLLDQQLPSQRLLRYGPHDIHEYRGKFFPQLVKSFINAAGLDRGSIVLDPTCGSGTANCEARSMGMQTIGIDLNPLSVLIARTKTAILSLDPAELNNQASGILSRIPEERPITGDPTKRWQESDLKYLKRWFSNQALKEVTYLLDIIESCENPTVRRLWQVCLSNTIRAVSWQKESDLRVRKDVTEYNQGLASQLLREQIEYQVGKLEKYLALLEDNRPLPSFEILEGDARRIHADLSDWVGKCDVIITSPPYATALPYIDTDRLSLIVLGLLPRSNHRDREYRMIGNREILKSQRRELWDTYQSRRNELPTSVCDLIDELAEAYHTDEVGFRRRNLPALLSRYYLDMLEAMKSARHMVKRGSFAFYIVGNNSTRVEKGKRTVIPTNEFLWEIGARAGWQQVEFIDMDMLPSRDIFRKNTGTSESILVFKSGTKRTAIYGDLRSESTENGEVEDEGWDFPEADTQMHLHSMHPYPARFIPQIPAKAIFQYSGRGDRILDPFCGCGTTLLESMLMQRPSIGVDNNAVACLVSRAKTARYSIDDLKKLVDFRNNVSLNRMESDETNVWIPEYRNRDYWFDPAALNDLGFLRYAINQLPEPAYSFALAVFSSIIVRASNQDSDTRYTKVDRTYEPGSALVWYEQNLSVAISGLKAIIDAPRAPVDVQLTDGRDLEFIEANTIQLIVTSPPYINTYDYHKYHRHRLHWIGGDVKLARDHEIGKHDVFSRPNADPQRYFSSMRDCFREWYRVLRPSGYALIVVGDGIVSGQPIPVGDQYVRDLQDVGFTLKNRWLRNLMTSKKSFNQQARIKQEHVLLVKKP